jgi:putative flippase GtrA
MGGIYQFFKFAIVGVVNTLINLAVFFILTDVFGVYYMFSAIFAFMVAVTNSFIMNSLWTFNYKISYNPAKKYSKFFIVSVLALIVTLVLLYFFTESLKIHYLISQVFAIFFSLGINFLGNKFWTFR